MVKVSAATLSKWKNVAEKANQRLSRVKEKGEAVVEKVTRTMVTTGTAFGMGVVQGRTGGVELLGIPLDLALGVGAHVGGFMRVAGRRSDMLHNIGDGAMAAYAVAVGRGVGDSWKKTGKFLGGAKSSGELPEAGSASMTDEALADSVLHPARR